MTLHDMRNHDRPWNIIMSTYMSEKITSCLGHSAPGCKYQKAIATTKDVLLERNDIGNPGTVALADALQAILVVCLSSRVRDLFLWP